MCSADFFVFVFFIKFVKLFFVLVSQNLIDNFKLQFRQSTVEISKKEKENETEPLNT